MSRMECFFFGFFDGWWTTNSNNNNTSTMTPKMKTQLHIVILYTRVQTPGYPVSPPVEYGDDDR